MEGERITVERLEEYRDALRVGQIVRVPKAGTNDNLRPVITNKKAVIEAKYPHIVRTSLGDYKYIDLYLIN